MFDLPYKWGHDQPLETGKLMTVKLQDILISHWLFGVLPGKVIANLSHQFTTRIYKKGQQVFLQEDLADRLFVILEGEVSIETLSLEGKVIRISQLYESEIFGELALIDKKGRSASAQAARATTLASLPAAVFHELLMIYPEFSNNLLSVIVDRLRSTNQQVESLVALTLMQRTAQLLMQLSKKSGPEINITQTDLAERLFATREKVNTKLKELERIGAIKTGRGNILIKDVIKLSAQIELT